MSTFLGVSLALVLACDQSDGEEEFEMRLVALDEPAEAPVDEPVDAPVDEPAAAPAEDPDPGIVVIGIAGPGHEQEVFPSAQNVFEYCKDKGFKCLALKNPDDDDLGGIDDHADEGNVEPVATIIVCHSTPGADGTVEIWDCPYTPGELVPQVPGKILWMGCYGEPVAAETDPNRVVGMTDGLCHTSNDDWKIFVDCMADPPSCDANGDGIISTQEIKDKMDAEGEGNP